MGTVKIRDRGMMQSVGQEPDVVPLEQGEFIPDDRSPKFVVV